MGKRVPIKEFPTQGRYGIGTTAMDLTGKAKIVSATMGEASDKVIVVTSKGARAIKFDDAPKRKRAMRGASIIELKNDDTVTTLVPFINRLHIEEPKPPKKRKSVSKQLALDVKVPMKKNVKEKRKNNMPKRKPRQRSNNAPLLFAIVGFMLLCICVVGGRRCGV